MALSPEQIVADRYRVVGEIASGGMGTVYRVVSLRDGLPFAFKVIRRDLSPGPSTVERFRREAKLLSLISHPGVVQMVDAGLLRDGSAFIVMELLEGETLLDYLRRVAPVSAKTIAPIVVGIAAALDAVHGHGVIHRDLKPSNIFLTKDGVKLVDFGVASATHVTRLTMTGQVVGTVRYMAPEQLLGDPVDHRADVYALGIIVWGALAGGPPFVGKGMEVVREILDGVPRLDEVVPALGRELADVVHQATARDQNGRFTSAGAFADALMAVVAAAPLEPIGRATGFRPVQTTRTGVTRAQAQAEPRAGAEGHAFSPPAESETSPSQRVTRRRSAGARVAGGVAFAAAALVAFAWLTGPRTDSRDDEAAAGGVSTVTVPAVLDGSFDADSPAPPTIPLPTDRHPPRSSDLLVPSL